MRQKTRKNFVTPVFRPAGRPKTGQIILQHCLHFAKSPLSYGQTDKRAKEDREFYLVHGFPGTTVHDEVWQRPQPDTPNPIPGKTLLIGHTPVVCLGRSDAEADVLCG